jgi:hypothetical protein
MPRTFAPSQICGGNLTLKNLPNIYKPYLIWFSSLPPQKPLLWTNCLLPILQKPQPIITLRMLFSLSFHDLCSPLSSENTFTWHTDHPSVDESLIAGCSSYRAFERYLEGNDLFLLPRTRGELESILCVPSFLLT